MHPLAGPDNDGSTPLFLASGAPPVCIRCTMAPSSPKSNKTSLSPFLLSKGVCEAGKHEKNGAKKVHQMMPRASNDALGRIDTRRCARKQPLSPETGPLQLRKCPPSQSEEKRRPHASNVHLVAPIAVSPRRQKRQPAPLPASTSAHLRLHCPAGVI